MTTDQHSAMNQKMMNFMKDVAGHKHFLKHMVNQHQDALLIVKVQGTFLFLVHSEPCGDHIF
jgi:hypothetical protein